MSKTLTTTFALLIATSPAVAERIQSVAWPELADRVSDILLPIEALAITDWSDERTANEDAARTVVQFIENTLYEWQEYDVVDQGETRVRIRMVQPESRDLTIEEAHVLLSASRMWMNAELAGQTANAERLDPSDPTVSSLIEDPVIENGETQMVLGSDDRIRVLDTTTFPFNTVAFVGGRLPNGIQYRGTGFLVSPYTLLTNGHVVYDRASGEYAEEIVVAPGQTQETSGSELIRPYASQNAASWVTNSVYRNNPDSSTDYGAIFLESPFSGISTYMPLVFDEVPSGTINVAGFPGEAQGEPSFAMWRCVGQILDVLPRVLHFSADVTGGNSGGPVWKYASATNSRRVVGLVSFSGTSYNGGPRLVSQNRDLIMQWMSHVPADNTPPTVTETSPCAGCSIDSQDRIVLNFSEPIAATQVDGSDIRVEHQGVGIDGTFDWSNNDHRLTWRPLVPFDAGNYEVRLSGRAAGDFQDLRGNLLDGDGNGTAGGDYVLSFTLEQPSDDRYEPNNDFDSASKVEPGRYTLRALDQDNFWIETGAGTVTVEIESQTGDLDLRFWHQQGDDWIELESVTSGSNELIQTEVQGGPNFIRVVTNDASAPAYDLSVNFEPAHGSKPDLVVDSITPLKSSIRVDEPFYVDVRISNEGSVDAPAFKMGSGNNCSSAVSIDGLAAGESRTVRYGSLAYSKSGAHVLDFVADACEELDEAIESNNRESITIMIEGSRDSSPSPSNGGPEAACQRDLCGVCTTPTMALSMIGFLGMRSRVRRRN